MEISEDQVKNAVETLRPWLTRFSSYRYLGFGEGKNHPECLTVFGENMTEDEKNHIEKEVKRFDIPVEFEPATPTELR